MIYDGEQEQVRTGTKFQSNLKKYGIYGHKPERERSNQNLTEGVIWELIKKCYREMFRTYCPRRLWSNRYPYIAKIMQLTATHDGRLQGQTSLELIAWETPDISEFLGFGWYARVWFKEDAGLRETQIGQFLGPSHKFG